MNKRMSAVKKIVLKKFPDVYCENMNGKRGDNLFILRFGKNERIFASTQTLSG